MCLPGHKLSLGWVGMNGYPLHVLLTIPPHIPLQGTPHVEFYLEKLQTYQENYKGNHNQYMTLMMIDINFF
jgi:hypothetical protein